MHYPSLINAALAAATTAYAPYSGFKVGAAVLLDNGKVITANNQENASYGLSMCAERVAVNYALSQNFLATIKALAVVSLSADKLVTPCGACRQVMAEVMKRQKTDFDVIMKGESGVVVKKVSELLPMAFEL